MANAERTTQHHMLSTSDNPWNPWTHFDEWLAYDMHEGHNTLGYLARITMTSDEISEADQDVAIENAIDEIVEMNLNGLMIAVPKPEIQDSES